MTSTPIINLNGTSRDELLAQRVYLADALRDCLRALHEAAPHGRDYPGAPERLADARSRHLGRLDAIQSLMSEVEQEAEEIYAAAGAGGLTP